MWQLASLANPKVEMQTGWQIEQPTDAQMWFDAALTLTGHANGKSAQRTA